MHKTIEDGKHLNELKTPNIYNGCVDCDECIHRDVMSVFDISENDDECPLLK